MYKIIFSAVLHVRQQRKSDVITYFDHSARSAIYYSWFPVILSVTLEHKTSRTSHY
jgi:hypothetical protein